MTCNRADLGCWDILLNFVEHDAAGIVGSSIHVSPAVGFSSYTIRLAFFKLENEMDKFIDIELGSTVLY